MIFDGLGPVQKAPHGHAMMLRVMKGEPRASIGISSQAILGAALGMALTCAGPALAGPVDSLRQVFSHHSNDNRDAAAASVGRYVSEDGDVFILDRSGPKALLRFESSFEVWALTPQQAPRGDMIYKNDLGEPVLRATRLGGLTIFTEHRPDGEAAALVGIASPLKLAIMGPAAFGYRLAEASDRASRVARRIIVFGADATPTSAPLIADAALVTSAALVRIGKRSDGRQLLDRILRVELIEGPKASVQLSDGVLLVVVVPPQGLAGRPSSDRILQVAGHR